MTFQEYQNIVQLYAKYNEQLGPYVTVLNVFDAAGKFGKKLSELIKEDGTVSEKDLNKASLLIGDILFWLTITATTLGLNFEGIAELNIRKNELLDPKITSKNENNNEQ